MKAYPRLYEFALQCGDVHTAKLRLLGLASGNLRAELEIAFADGEVPEPEYLRLRAEIGAFSRSIRARFLWRARQLIRAPTGPATGLRTGAERG